MSLPVYTPPPREPVTWRSRRERFAQWRGTRPFWGGVWTIVAGVYLWGLTAAPIGVVVIQGVAGISAIVICLVYILLTLVAWSQPQLRVVTGGIVIVLALAAILLTNLGGFIVGTLMGLHGGASMIAWKPFVRRWSRPTPPDGVTAPVTVLVNRADDEQDATAAGADAAGDAPADAAADAPDGTQDTTTADDAAAAPAEPADDAPAAPRTPPRGTGMAPGLTILPSSPPPPVAPEGPAPGSTGSTVPGASAGHSFRADSRSSVVR